MNVFLFVIALAFSAATNAQVRSVELQASGLTCSMCSNAINKALRKLDFIDTIKTDLKQYTFTLSFKPGAIINFDRIKQKVEDAGFSVSSFVATINFDNVTINNNEPLAIQNHRFIFVSPVQSSLNGMQRITLLDRGFIKNSNKNKLVLQAPAEAGIYHVSL